MYVWCCKMPFIAENWFSTRIFSKSIRDLSSLIAKEFSLLMFKIVVRVIYVRENFKCSKKYPARTWKCKLFNSWYKSAIYVNYKIELWVVIDHWKQAFKSVHHLTQEYTNDSLQTMHSVCPQTMHTVCLRTIRYPNWLKTRKYFEFFLAFQLKSLFSASLLSFQFKPVFSKSLFEFSNLE